jgi:hypothetical protein
LEISRFKISKALEILTIWAEISVIAILVLAAPAPIMTLEFTAITPLILVLIAPAAISISLPEALTFVPRLEWFPLHFGLHYLNKSSPVSRSWLNSTQEFRTSTKLPDITRTRRESVGRRVPNPSGGDPEPSV